MKRILQFIAFCLLPIIKWVLLITLTVLLCMALFGCCPCRKISTATQSDSVRVEVRESIVKVRDTVYIEVPAESVAQTVRDTTSHLETEYATSDARINADGTLTHSLRNKPQKRAAEVEAEVIYRDSIVYRDKQVTDIVEVNVLRWWQKVLCWAGGIALALLGLGVALKIGKIVSI